MSRIKSAHSSKDQAHLAKIIEQNIHTIINTRRVTANQRTTEERLADTVTNFSGRMYFDLLTVLLFGLIWIGIVTFLWLKKKKSLAYLIFFTIFYVYIVKVLDYTLFQFQSLVLLKHFMPDLILNGQTVGNCWYDFKLINQDGSNVNVGDVEKPFMPMSILFNGQTVRLLVGEVGALNERWE